MPADCYNAPGKDFQNVQSSLRTLPWSRLSGSAKATAIVPKLYRSSTQLKIASDQIHVDGADGRTMAVSRSHLAKNNDYKKSGRIKGKSSLPRLTSKL